jgi:hypothetical protein
MRELGLPMDPVPQLEARCAELLRRVMGEQRHQQYAARGLIEHPQLLGLQRRYSDDIIISENKDYPTDHPEMRYSEVGDPTPLPAWRIDYAQPQYDGPVQRCLRASYAAFKWLQKNETLAALPRIRDGP